MRQCRSIVVPSYSSKESIPSEFRSKVRVIPFADKIVLADLNVGILYLFATSSLNVYGIVMAGWSSNSKYPFLGALRSAAQMISYEVSIGFIIINVCICTGSFNLSCIITAQTNV
mgnify:CR=1 FL=1